MEYSQDIADVEHEKVSSDSLVDVDTNRYSVPWAYRVVDEPDEGAERGASRGAFNAVLQTEAVDSGRAGVSSSWLMDRSNKVRCCID